MATAIIPLAIQLAPVILPVAVNLIKDIEGLFGHKTGPSKKQLVTDALMQVTSALATAGNITHVPTVEEIGHLVEIVVQVLKAQGVLEGRSLGDPKPVTMPLPFGVYQIRPGLTLTISQ